MDEYRLCQRHRFLPENPQYHRKGRSISLGCSASNTGTRFFSTDPGSPLLRSTHFLYRKEKTTLDQSRRDPFPTSHPQLPFLLAFPEFLLERRRYSSRRPGRKIDLLLFNTIFEPLWNNIYPYSSAYPFCYFLNKNLHPKYLFNLLRFFPLCFQRGQDKGYTLQEIKTPGQDEKESCR